MEEILEIKEGDNFKDRTFLIQQYDTSVILVKRHISGVPGLQRDCSVLMGRCPAYGNGKNCLEDQSGERQRRFAAPL